MSISSLIGKTGDPVPTSCKVFNPEMSVHWYPPNSTTCYCGVCTRDESEVTPPKRRKAKR